MSSPAQGRLTVSVDLPSETTRFPSAARELLQLLRGFDIPATWSVSTLSHPLVGSILDDPLDHEVALSAAPVSGLSVTRRQVAQHLVRARIAAARDGISLTTLALRGGDLDPRHHDLLVKHEFSMIRERLSHPTAIAPLQSVRYGIWKSPVAAVITSGNHGRVFGPAARSVRIMHHCVANCGSVHVGIDATSSARSKTDNWTGVRRVLTRAARLRDRGQLVCVTLQQIAHDLQQRGRRSRASGSVLRAA